MAVTQTHAARSRIALPGWLGLCLFMLLLSTYFVCRYNGLWAENDTAAFSRTIRQFVHDGQLIPTTDVYPNGFAYQSISAFIINITGLDVTTLQQLIYPFTTILLVFPAWIAYRELTGSALGATLASILLFTQPEFLFVILRSSHEKFLRTLLFLCLFLLVRSFKFTDRPWLMALHVVLFYIAIFSMVATNNLLGNSFIFAVALAFGFGWILSLRNRSINLFANRTLRRLTYISFIGLGITFVFTFYLYTPARSDLLLLKTLGERSAALILDVQSQSKNSYAQVLSGWVNLPIYFAVSIANWIILGISVCIWVVQGWRWFIQQQQPKSHPTLILWLLYAAFALQGALTVVTDASGYIGNLQNRIFPSFSIFAVALVGAALAQWRPQHFPVAIRGSLSVGIAAIALLSIFKATNEPILSNKWLFYRPEEAAALLWSDAHLQNALIWTEYDERLTTALVVFQDTLVDRNTFMSQQNSPTTPYMLLTDVTRLRSQRLGRPLPVPADALQVYDNGESQFYHLRPQTQYQK